MYRRSSNNHTSDFILYVNDLLWDMQKYTIPLYADDTVVISGVRTWAAARNFINHMLEKAAGWLLVNPYL